MFEYIWILNLCFNIANKVLICLNMFEYVWILNLCFNIANKV